MSGFLDQMALSSTVRVAQAKRYESLAALEVRAAERCSGPILKVSPLGFDVIAELKIRSPAAGVLGNFNQGLDRVLAYARGGAAAVSVLTEPSRFEGSLEHLRVAAAALTSLAVPVMRKDFIVDPYQVLEARAAGAGGVLLIVRMLSRALLSELLEVAATYGQFVLLETFDEADLTLAYDLLNAKATNAKILVGVNCRDLQTLEIDPIKFPQLASQLSTLWPAVAESGVSTPEDARAVRDLGFSWALIGTALMRSPEPDLLLAEILDAARASHF